MTRRTSKGFCPFLTAVWMTDATVAWFSAPSSERKYPLTFNLVLAGLNAFSESLLVGGTAGSARKVKM